MIHESACRCARLPAMGDQELDSGFRVTDRRRRGEDEPGPAAAEPEPRAPVAEPAPEVPPSPGPPRERTLVGLFAMLGSLAAHALGAVPDPSTGQVQLDLEQASELIDLLMLLRERTEGRRSAEESEVLEQVIYDLQVRWISVATPPEARAGRARR